MKPPYHPEHPERVIGPHAMRTVQAVCGAHWAGPEYALGATLPDGRTVARALADDFNSHRATYVD